MFELQALSDEIRESLLKKLSQHGGHIGPNLGLLELTAALHYLFDDSIDKLVFDVSHQSYTHKMLTGRTCAFLEESHCDDVTGFTNTEESEYDLFHIGHTSTFLSLANGLAKSRDIQGQSYNRIAVIGDGFLFGREAYEGSNNIVELNMNTIMVINDNNQSIAENYGGIYRNLESLRGYLKRGRNYKG